MIINIQYYPILSNKDSCPYCLNNKNTNICTGYNKCKLRRKLEILSLKLYKYGATIEFFIYSELSNMEGYSTINRYPEILDTIEGISSHIPNNKISKLRLGCDWEKQKKCYIIEFSSTLSNMETYEPIDYVKAYYNYENAFYVNGYSYDDYINKEIPQNVINNLILVKWFINVYLLDVNEELGSLLPNKCVPADDITIIEIHNNRLIYI